MAYTKTLWVDDETALSANNMNHIENGILELDTNTTQFQTTATEQISSLEENKLNANSDKIIQDVEAEPQTEGALICRKDNKLYLYTNASNAPAENDLADTWLSPVTCAYSTLDDLVAAIEQHGLTDQTGKFQRDAIHMFDLYTSSGTLVDKIYVVAFRVAPNYVLSNWDNLVGGTIRQYWDDGDWVDGALDISSYFAELGHSNLVMKNISDFAKSSMRNSVKSFDEIANKNDLTTKINKQNPKFTGTLESEGNYNAGAEIIHLNTRNGRYISLISNAYYAEISGTEKLRFSNNVRGVIFVYDDILLDDANTGTSSDNLLFTDSNLQSILNSSEAPKIINIKVSSEFFNDSNKAREFTMTRINDGTNNIYFQIYYYNSRLYKVFLHPKGMEMWFEEF